MAMTGGCLCGRVRYEIGAPMIFGGFCYCMDCRKQSGSHSASMAVPEAAVQLSGDVREYETKGDSGSQVKRVFCPNCGSALLSRGARPGVVMIKAGTLDDPEQFKPMASIYVSRAPSWDPPRPGLPSFAEMPPQPPSGQSDPQ